MKVTHGDLHSLGFTLVELLVSISIFTIITTIAVMNHAQFNSSILLTNLAYEIGLSIRQAQVYGITVKQSTTDSSKFDSGYGIHFDLSQVGGSGTTYKLFEDVNVGGLVDHVYSNVTDEDIEMFRIQKGNSISGIYVNGDEASQPVVDISFIRPNPEAYIMVSGTRYSKAEICIKSPQGTKRKVVVEISGQISVVADNVNICSN
ncbi:MAG: prepilin-type N-terminal cleavage/methylation domain-containing protein [Patescibacteria group bacterium]|mgnify:CR=1 FL=1